MTVPVVAQHDPQAAVSAARVEYLETVDGMVVYDMPNAPSSGGGTRLAPDLTEREMRLLARAMTYKLGAVGIPVGGAKLGLRAAPEQRQEVVARFRAEIAAPLASGRLMTGPDLGTTEADFVGLPLPGRPDGVASTTIGGLPAEEVLTGIGVVAALDAALPGGLDGQRIVLEGFGKMGTSIARALAGRGARIVAVSTLAGCAVCRGGRELRIPDLLEARADAGDRLVARLGASVLPREAVWSVPCDALVPGARPGVIDERVARTIAAGVVVPVANAPYTRAGLGTLRTRRIAAHADFVASAGGAMAYLSPAVAQASDPDEARAAVDAIMADVVARAAAHPDGPYAGAVALAEAFIRTWAPASDWPAGPPLL